MSDQASERTVERYQGVMRLPGKGLLVTQDALGGVYDCALPLGGAIFAVHLPRPSATPDVSSEFESPLAFTDGDHYGGWGAITMTHQHALIHSVWLDMRILLAKFLEGDEYLQPQLDTWFTTALRWVEVWSRQSVQLARDTTADLQIDGNLRSAEPRSDEPVIFFWPRDQSDFAVPDADVVATPAQLQVAFSRASAGEQLPAEWVALTHARRSINNRLAVIEAATAAEMAMAGAVKRYLPGVPPEGITKIIRGANGSAGLVKLLDALAGRNPGETSRNRVNSQLAEPRNLAIHSGIEPTKERAQAAIATATDLLNEFSPLPTA